MKITKGPKVTVQTETSSSLTLWLLHNIKAELIQPTSIVNTCVTFNKPVPQVSFGISKVSSVTFLSMMEHIIHLEGQVEVFMNDKLRFTPNIPDEVLLHFRGL